ncbi:MAG: type II toxin-antitoxin system VapC family toxin [Spirochaetia bacterium]|jgi:predicted nucleic acid-binding protein
MISAVDSSVILDVLADAPAFAESSMVALRQCAQEGRLIVCETVIAEVYPAIADPLRFNELLSDWQLDFVPSTVESAVTAGTMFAVYLKRAGVGKRAHVEKKRVVADFLIGAHALVHADRLIARDRGFFRGYFKDLTVLDPSALPGGTH